MGKWCQDVSCCAVVYDLTREDNTLLTAREGRIFPDPPALTIRLRMGATYRTW